MTSRSEDGFAHVGNRIRRTARIRGIAPVQHRHIVEMVAGGNHLVMPDPEHPTKLPQCGAFVIIAMGKPQVDRIALVGKVRHQRAFLFQ